MFRPCASRAVLGLFGLLAASCTLNEPLTRDALPNREQPDAAPDAAAATARDAGGEIDRERDSGPDITDPPPGGACDDGQAIPCGPSTEDGICNLGLRICEDGVWSEECIDAVYPAERDCTSSVDNDCDGQPDNVADGPCVCVPGTTQACDAHPGLDGNGPCRAGVSTCEAAPDKRSSAWGACVGSVGPAAADSCAAEGDDANCNGLPNDGCTCVEGRTYRCGPSTDVGVCAFGTTTCAGGRLGACVGAVSAGTRDCGALPGVDNDCDGVADNTVDTACTCAVGAKQACNTHPGLDGTGECKAGERTCAYGPTRATSAFGACIGAVGPTGRNCGSSLDNDCNGIRDNTIDALCTCALGAGPQPCNAPPAGQASLPCRAGLRECVAGPGNATSSFSSCLGAVAPLAADSCAVAGDDATCDGVPNGGCECVTGLGNAGCAARPNASVCVAPGVCAPCSLPADCALVAGRNVCAAGVCVECTAADARACAADEVCENQVCVARPVTPVTALCGACTSDVTCGPNARCVAQLLGGGSACFPLSVAGACASPPYNTPTAATSVDGAAASVCMPRATTCQALADFDRKLCNAIAGIGDHAACGEVAVDDGLCVLTPAAGASGRCSVPCTPTGNDCPRGACVGGACEVTTAVTSP